MTDHIKHAASGHLLRKDNGHLIHDCQVEDAPCLCPQNLANSYAIDLNLLEACPGCIGGNCTTTVSWDGTFQRYSACNWIGLNADQTSWPPGQCLQIDGKNLSNTQLRLDPYNCIWVISVICFSEGSENTLWQGTKSTGNTPAGIYTKTQGCVILPTLNVY
ncbi:MAG: hypothetical protein CMJ19_20490 [Phycisphaeraceae bacterium]|nr:hypothetical protein [Phycisphaeraceae bacterium]